MPQFVTSKDGTTISYDTVGDGTPVILVLGALNTGKSGAKLAKPLASKFTVVSYDRRGRGKSADTAPYSPACETEDMWASIRVTARVGSAAIAGSARTRLPSSRASRRQTLSNPSTLT